MAGSFSHIVSDDDGSFRMDLIDHMGDAHEALEECYDIIAAFIEMSGRGIEALDEAMKRSSTNENGTGWIDRSMFGEPPCTVFPVVGRRHASLDK